MSRPVKKKLTMCSESRGNEWAGSDAQKSTPSLQRSPSWVFGDTRGARPVDPRLQKVLSYGQRFSQYLEELSSL